MLKAFFIGLLLISASFARPVAEQDARTVFKRLKDSDFGKDLFTSIQLELSSSSDAHIVDRILNMLQELYDQMTTQKNDAIEDRGTKRGFCYSKISDLEYEVEGLEEKIARARLTLPTLVEQHDSKVTQMEERSQDVNANQDDISETHERNEAAIERYAASVQDHNDMIDALRRAKEIISQLVVTNFLQRQDIGTSLVELKNIQDSVSKKHHSGLLNVLITLSQDVHADQDQVANIVAIIDELIAAEQKTMQIERKAEEKRQQRFEYNLQRFQEAEQFLDATIKDLKADSITLNTRMIELQNDVQGWQQTAADKQEQRDLQESACDSQINALDAQVDEYNDLLDIIRQLIRIFNSQAIQDIRGVVSEM